MSFNFHNISLIGGPGVLPMSRAPVALYTLHEHWLLVPRISFGRTSSRLANVRNVSPVVSVQGFRLNYGVIQT